MPRTRERGSASLDEDGDDENPLVHSESEALDRPKWAQGFERKGDWQAQWFPSWRRAFFYDCNGDFGQSLELAVRGALVLVLFAVPRIWGLDKDPESYFYKNELFDLGAILAFVYTLYGSVGITFSYALQGIAGTAMAALVSYFMYAVFPDGTSGVEWGSGSTVFGAVFGCSVVIVSLLLNFSVSFHIFFVSNFVYFWMEFMNSSAPKRSLIDVENQDNVLWLQFTDWGGGALEGTVKMCVGAGLAIAATMLPYPILSMEKARDTAATLVSVLAETWFHAIEFYLGEDLDDMKKAKLQQNMGRIKGNLNTVSMHLDGGWWERFFLRPCFGAKHRLLTKLEATTSRCFERLAHVVDACDREQFEDAHDELMRRDRCGGAVRELARAANELLQFAADRAEDGHVSESEKEELRDRVAIVLAAEQELTRKVWASLKEVMTEQSQKYGRDMSEEVGEALVDEQIFLFSLCDFGGSIRGYAEWLIDHGDKGGCYQDNAIPSYFKNLFDPEVILSSSRLNFTLRIALSVLLCWLIGYSGYHHMIKPWNASIASTASVLLSHTTVSPVSKSLGRLQGVVLGLWCGQMSFALLGYCDPWYQAALSVVVFMYVCGTLFIYYYDSPFSYIGCLAAAFGTQAFLEGCGDQYVEVGANAFLTSDLIVAIAVMAAVDSALSLGRPSEMAYEAYLQAWTTWDEVLTHLLTPDSGSADLSKVKGLIAQAEVYASEAATEPRYWRQPFERELFSNMIALAKVMRTQVICIEQVVMQRGCLDSSSSGIRPRSMSSGISSVSDSTLLEAGCPEMIKKAWFREAMARDTSIWHRLKEQVMEEMDRTFEMVRKLRDDNVGLLARAEPRGGRRSSAVKKAGTLSRRMGAMKFGFSELSRATTKEPGHLEEPSLVDDERAQKNFVFGCLKTIKYVNCNLQLQVVRNSIAGF